MRKETETTLENNTKSLAVCTRFAQYLLVDGDKTYWDVVGKRPFLEWRPGVVVSVVGRINELVNIGPG